MSDEDEYLATIMFRSDLTDPHVPEVEIEITLPQLWHVYRAIHGGGFDEARTLISFFGRIMGALLDAKVEDTAVSFDEVWEAFGAVFDLRGRQWGEETDLALSFCYYLLREELINRTEAAELIRALQQEERSPPPDPADVEAFRKRVDRWAERHGLPRPGRPRRRVVTA